MNILKLQCGQKMMRYMSLMEVSHSSIKKGLSERYTEFYRSGRDKTGSVKHAKLRQRVLRKCVPRKAAAFSITGGLVH